jgi:hypothetical protein
MRPSQGQGCCCIAACMLLARGEKPPAPSMQRLGAEQRWVVEMLANEIYGGKKMTKPLNHFLSRGHTRPYASLEDHARCVIWHLSTSFGKKFVSTKPRTSPPRVLALCLTSASCRGSCQLSCSRAQCPRAESGQCLKPGPRVVPDRNLGGPPQTDRSWAAFVPAI